jgi:hypothetical protein
MLDVSQTPVNRIYHLRSSTVALLLLGEVPLELCLGFISKARFWDKSDDRNGFFAQSMLRVRRPGRLPNSSAHD